MIKTHSQILNIKSVLLTFVGKEGVSLERCRVTVFLGRCPHQHAFKSDKSVKSWQGRQPSIQFSQSRWTSVNMQHNPRGRKSLFVKCKCVRVFTYPSTQQHCTWCVCQRRSAESQTNAIRHRQANRHTTPTQLCGPTRYDLHLRDGRYGEEKEEEAEGGGRR